jgi:hypothetical protein
VLLIRVDALQEEQVVQLVHLVVALGGPSIYIASPPWPAPCRWHQQSPLV